MITLIRSQPRWIEPRLARRACAQTLTEQPHWPTHGRNWLAARGEAPARAFRTSARTVPAHPSARLGARQARAVSLLSFAQLDRQAAQAGCVLMRLVRPAR